MVVRVAWLVRPPLSGFEGMVPGVMVLKVCDRVGYNLADSSLLCLRDGVNDWVGEEQSRAHDSTLMYKWRYQSQVAYLLRARSALVLSRPSQTQHSLAIFRPTCSYRT